MNDDIPDDSARAEEVVVGWAEALGVPVIPKPAQEQHDEDQHLQEKVQLCSALNCGPRSQIILIISSEHGKGERLIQQKTKQRRPKKF